MDITVRVIYDPTGSDDITIKSKAQQWQEKNMPAKSELLAIYNFGFFSVQFFIAIWNTIMIHKAQLTAMVTWIIPIWNNTSLSKFTKQVNSWDSVTQTNI